MTVTFVESIRVYKVVFAFVFSVYQGAVISSSLYVLYISSLSILTLRTEKKKKIGVNYLLHSYHIYQHCIANHGVLYQTKNNVLSIIINFVWHTQQFIGLM